MPSVQRLTTFSILLLLLIGLMMPSAGWAQTNPFADEAEKEEPKKKKKKKKKRKKRSKKKSKKQREKEAAEEAARLEEEAKAAEEAAAAAALAEAEAKAEAEAAEEAEAEPEALFQSEPVEEPESGSVRIPVAANFSTFNLGVDAGALAVGGALILLEGNLLGKDAPSMGDPVRGSVDYGIAESFHGDLVDGGPFLFGASDILGYTLIAGPALFYGVSASLYWMNDEPMMDSQSVNIDHAFWGYFETMAWAAASVGITKTLIGRNRPYTAFERPNYGDTTEEWQSSFLSAFATLSFSAASYVSWDLSDNLVHKQDKGFLIGRVLPFAVFYGTATLVSFGTMYQQEAFFSDALVGAGVGALIGNLVYAVHFDDKGDPRVRNPDAMDSVSVSFNPTLIPTHDSVMMGIGANGSW